MSGLLLLHLAYPLPYVYRVLVYQDSDFSDIYRFPARSIEPAAVPSGLPSEPDSAAMAIIEGFHAVDDLDEFLDDTATSAFIVMHRGRLVLEYYAEGHGPGSLQNTFSVSKSIASSLVGLAVRDGLLELTSPITEYIPELAERDNRFSKITVEHLLDMKSGIRYAAGVDFPFVDADDALIYYHPDLESVILRRTTVEGPPGSFEYNNYNPPLLGLIVRRTSGMTVGAYLERELWQPMGAEYEAGWTVDDRGFERMESGFHARARDLARLGLLYLEDGRAGGRQILPADWILKSTDEAGPWNLDRYDGRSWGYRGGWWIVPREMGRSDFCAIGRLGQFLYVSPQYDVVIVRNGPGRGDWGDYDWTEFFFYLAENLGQQSQPALQDTLEMTD